MIWSSAKILIETERMQLRLPESSDFRQWTDLRTQSIGFLQQWEPMWAEDYKSRKAFKDRVSAAKLSVKRDSALPLFLIRRHDQAVIGGLTLDNIHRGPSQSATLGYWIGAPFARQGYMFEALRAASHFAFVQMDISRLEAACLPENTPSRGVLEKAGFKYEGVAQSYLQINGRWRSHVLYALLRGDRRGRTDIR